MKDTSGENAAVEQLLAERDALHGWLQRLDAASVEASEAVRERVRRDYQVRLDLLTGALREHGDAIAQRLAADQSEQAELLERTAASRDALAEVELRHAVGEFPAERYQTDQRRHLSDIEAFELSLAAVSERIARMEEVLAQVTRAPRAPELELGLPEASSAAESGSEPTPSIVEFAPERVDDTGEADAEGEGEASVDVAEEITSVEALAPDDVAERLRSIFGEEEHAPSAGRPKEAAGSTPDFGPLSFRPSGAAPSREMPPIGLPADAPPRFIRPGDRLAATAPSWPVVPPATPPRAEEPAAAEPIAAPSSGIFSEEIVASGPTPIPASTVGRTLRCGECGAMNRPLEWYCEKCGAELSAV